MSSPNESGQGLPMALQYHDNAALRRRFAHARPFPHVVIDDFLDPAVAEHVLDALPPVGEGPWRQHPDKSREGPPKYSLQRKGEMPAVLQDVFEMFRSPAYRQWLAQLTGIDNLVAPAKLAGAGVHAIPRGGRLGVHVDFNAAKPRRAGAGQESHLYRRLNTFVYLNPEWSDRWGGHLELWRGKRKPRKREAAILPAFNRFVAFEYSEHAWHGHPAPLECPHDRHRISLAMYYYTEEPPAGFSAPHGTVYAETPQSSAAA